MPGSATGKRRGGHYPVRRSVVLSEDTAAAIDSASDRYGIAAGAIIRDAVERGLKLTLNTYRKTARHDGGNAAVAKPALEGRDDGESAKRTGAADAEQSGHLDPSDPALVMLGAWLKHNRGGLPNHLPKTRDELFELAKTPEKRQLLESLPPFTLRLDDAGNVGLWPDNREEEAGHVWTAAELDVEQAQESGA